MTHLRQLCAVALLTIALAFTALGSDIDLPGTGSPLCAPTSTKPSDSSTPSVSRRSGYGTPAVDWLTEAKINFWHNLVSLF